MALKLFYACAYSVYGVILPFLPLILRSRGLSDSELSLALTAIGFAGIIPPLVFAHISDRLMSFQRLAPVMLTAGALTPPLWLLSNSMTFAFLVTLCFFSLYMPLLTLIDAYTLAYNHESGQAGNESAHFKNFRIWGSIGFVLPVALLPIIGLYTKVEATQLIVLGVLLGTFAIPVSRHIPAVSTPLRLPSLPSADALRIAFGARLRNFFIGSFCVGVPVSMFYILFPIYLQELGFSTTAIAFITSFGVLCEIVMIFSLRSLIMRFGIENIILLGALATVLRLLIIASVASPSIVIISQVLHGPLVTGIFVAIPMYLHTHAEPSFRFSLQGLYVALIFGVSRTIGPLLLAGLFSILPGNSLERIQSATIVAAAILAVGAVIMRHGLQLRNNQHSVPAPQQA